MYEESMTDLTRQSFNKAVSEDMTIEAAVLYLENQTQTRSLIEKLRKVYEGEDLREKLIRGLAENHPETKPDNVRRRVGNWLKAGNMPALGKDVVLEISFILNLDTDQANQLATMVLGEGLHWRDPDEIAFLYGLQHHLCYKDALALHARMQDALRQVPPDATFTSPGEDSFTSVIRQEISQLESEEELRAYILHAHERLGRFHAQGYTLFTEMLQILREPPETFPDEIFPDEEMEPEKLTIRQILREYLMQESVLYAKDLANQGKKMRKRSGQSYTEVSRARAGMGENEVLVLNKIQEEVARQWPTEEALSRMQSRQEDVTRKVLILLFLAVDEGLDASDDYLELDPTPDEVFQDLYTRLDAMLEQCGFAPLDPRAPFDWLIIYCLCAGDLWDISQQMQDVFQAMFVSGPDVPQTSGTRE